VIFLFHQPKSMVFPETCCLCGVFFFLVALGNVSWFWFSEHFAELEVSFYEPV